MRNLLHTFPCSKAAHNPIRLPAKYFWKKRCVGCLLRLTCLDTGTHYGYGSLYRMGQGSVGHAHLHSSISGSRGAPSQDAELVSACEKHQFDVVVIGQTVSLKMKRLICSLVKQHCPDVRILELYQPHVGKAVEDADSWLAVPADIPSALAEEVARLANIVAS